ncbi:hypothetical protein GCM10010324_20970 [Streptomyces hiroshimensis]|uniref:Uncharacterized protein n=1 Tax=Streptomyces hiroshimensis TaxID=66424 RepID=A0ABQ2Y8K4_9ACTN|nr:hypothetical protein GCM10010324_20970 [Streptomyces hiroshimensis]
MPPLDPVEMGRVRQATDALAYAGKVTEGAGAMVVPSRRGGAGDGRRPGRRAVRQRPPADRDAGRAAAGRVTGLAAGEALVTHLRDAALGLHADATVPPSVVLPTDLARAFIDFHGIAPAHCRSLAGPALRPVRTDPAHVVTRTAH